jgi:phosphoglycolate phosphatase
LAYLLDHLPPQEKVTPIMVGDTAFDVAGAAVHGIPTVGVSWGYGSAEELKQAGAICILTDPLDLLTYFR